MTDEYDYSAVTKQESKPSDKLEILRNLCAQMLEAEREVERKEAALKKAQADWKRLAQREIPDLLDELKIPGIAIDDKHYVEVGEEIRASIPKDRNDEAIEWLDKHGFAGVVKREFIISFARDQQAWANKFEADLRKRKREVDSKQKRYVEPQTLKKLIKNQLTNGRDIPLDLFGVFRQRVANLTRKE